MVVPIGEDEASQQMKRITRVSETNFKTEDFGPCAFVPFLSGVNNM